MSGLTTTADRAAGGVLAPGVPARRPGVIQPACLACGTTLATRTSYVPRPDGLYDVVTGVDQAALRGHLLEHHRRVPRQLAVAR